MSKLTGQVMTEQVMTGQGDGWIGAVVLGVMLWLLWTFLVVYLRVLE